MNKLITERTNYVNDENEHSHLNLKSLIKNLICCVSFIDYPIIIMEIIARIFEILLSLIILESTERFHSV